MFASIYCVNVSISVDIFHHILRWCVLNYIVVTITQKTEYW